MGDACILISTQPEFNGPAPGSLRREPRPVPRQPLNRTQKMKRSCVPAGKIGEELLPGATASTTSQHMVEGNRTSAKKDQGKGQGCGGEGKLVSRPFGRSDESTV
jgi:hypothetical protein